MNIDKRFISYIQNDIVGKINDIKTLGGGDISYCYVLTTNNQKLVLKVNHNSYAYEMLNAEKEGLYAINETKTIATPQVFHLGTFEKSSFLVMQFIENKKPNTNDFYKLGTSLFQLHQFSQKEFGWQKNNFIGSLTQTNNPNVSWVDFYVNERLLPQLKLAQSRFYLSHDEVPSIEKMQTVCKKFLGEPNASLLHGDLWNGNFIISSDGVPYLIDTATYYGHSEVDIAMTRLFGGFNNAFYEAYFGDNNITFYNERLDIYQLYYLLVHLNLFGKGYYASVNEILKKYFFKSQI